MDFDDKIDFLEGCGLGVASWITRAEFKSRCMGRWGRAELDGPTFDMALVCLGSAEENPPYRSYCRHLWHFDVECIEGRGSYVRIAKRMDSLAGGVLGLREIKDRFRGGRAELEFTSGDRRVHIELTVDDDWVDPGIMIHFVELLQERDPGRIFIYFNLGGQDCILGCISKDNMDRMSSAIPGVEPLY